MIIKQAVSKLLDMEDLSFEMTREVVDEIMGGKATNAQIAAFLTALRMKGETTDEITACASSMTNVGLKLQYKGDLLDIVGTGGDKSNTFNISTLSSIVISAAGVAVAKHGNKKVSSQCGSADVLEALGINIDIPIERSERILDEIGICFLYAPVYHSSMANVAPVRKELGIRTIFNILGPLTNPADASLRLIGVYDEKLVEPMAEVLKKMNVKRAMVVWGCDGLDEISLTGKTKVSELNKGQIKSYYIDPVELGFDYCQPRELLGGDPLTNADIARAILEGERGPRRDIVILNSAVCLYMAYSNMVLQDCIRLAAETIDSGKAMQQLTTFINLSNK